MDGLVSVMIMFALKLSNAGSSAPMFDCRAFQNRYTGQTGNNWNCSKPWITLLFAAFDQKHIPMIKVNKTSFPWLRFELLLGGSLQHQNLGDADTRFEVFEKVVLLREVCMLASNITIGRKGPVNKRRSRSHSNMEQCSTGAGLGRLLENVESPYVGIFHGISNIDIEDVRGVLMLLETLHNHRVTLVGGLERAMPGRVLDFTCFQITMRNWVYEETRYTWGYQEWLPGGQDGVLCDRTSSSFVAETETLLSTLGGFDPRLTLRHALVDTFLRAKSNHRLVVTRPDVVWNVHGRPHMSDLEDPAAVQKSLKWLGRKYAVERFVSASKRRLLPGLPEANTKIEQVSLSDIATAAFRYKYWYTLVGYFPPPSVLSESRRMIQAIVPFWHGLGDGRFVVPVNGALFGALRMGDVWPLDVDVDLQLYTPSPLEEIVKRRLPTFQKFPLFKKFTWKHGTWTMQLKDKWSSQSYLLFSTHNLSKLPDQAVLKSDLTAFPQQRQLDRIDFAGTLVDVPQNPAHHLHSHFRSYLEILAHARYSHSKDAKISWTWSAKRPVCKQVHAQGQVYGKVFPSIAKIHGNIHTQAPANSPYHLTNCIPNCTSGTQCLSKDRYDSW